MKQSQIFISSFHYTNIYLQEMTILIQYNYIKRLMIQYGYNIIKLSYVPKISHHKIYNKALLYLKITENNIPKNKTQKLTHLITDFILITKNKLNKSKKQIKQRENYIIPSGFKKLDKIIEGLSKGDLIIIAGRPSTGKTSFAINITSNLICDINKINIYFFSLEMSSQQILHKLISINSKISLKKINSYKLNTSEWAKIIQVCYKFINVNMYIDDNPNISIDYIEYTSYLSKKDNFNVGLIIIDYLQLIQSTLVNKINRSQELSYITRKLKLLAQTLNLTIIALSQLNRNIENRINKKPILSDLKESGCINIFFRSELKYNKYNYNVNCFNIINKSLNNIKINNIYIDFNNIKTILSISTKYNFCHQVNIFKKLLISYNHKIILYKSWFKQYFIVENSLVVKENKLSKLIVKKINYYFTNTINFSHYDKSYDLYNLKYFHFSCQNMILHNSIEQDADIVIMIYNKHEYLNDHLLSKTLDFIICKNRNGPTGSFELLFIPEITLFEN